ncbi:hypothetical protein G7K_5389-t1 [Saitoella complicata NRRL Y-17804]|uniref:Uncharacterized protein n=1 Tax=Saitoella complicata (strain BCRC 22490 / CBS 7301 / JCM 7358 / NBRC 10748 / NRRL Y-17804) TaxID=698492 RepID=A0A0E9NN72_SAICN|nr:hypothetical protein G7K_5389-t1 [Saitoella complicata NRRL Y-17804]
MNRTPLSTAIANRRDESYLFLNLPYVLRVRACTDRTAIPRFFYRISYAFYNAQLHYRILPHCNTAFFVASTIFITPSLPSFITFSTSTSTSFSLFASFGNCALLSNFNAS